MGLFKRLVVALEKIADKKEDYTEMGNMLNNAMRVQAKMQEINRQRERKENMKLRWDILMNRINDGKELTNSEKTEIEIGRTMFDK